MSSSEINEANELTATLVDGRYRITLSGSLGALSIGLTREELGKLLVTANLAHSTGRWECAHVGEEGRRSSAEVACE